MDWSEIMRGARYHEAGHAVAALRNGYDVTRVTATDEGWTTNLRGPRPSSWADALRAACITMAGQLADQRASWGEMRPEPWADFAADAELELEEVAILGEKDDRAELMDALALMAADPYGESLEECYRTVVEDSCRLVSEHWGEIEAVARALELRGSLDGAEVARVIEGAD